ncbi:STM3941 family protein [Bacteroides sp. 224]|uniref:STM3941 family protein n=1 Tax=Bacteroides sp. 224 TaxID=2302936 RepID=UPI0013D27337|nr:STM3941 family protein [Bacteroides sp. 224]NDV66607.1 hypothetical protein [Bacteroides sp. 224]
MTTKLPVKTFKLRPYKKVGLILSIIINLVLAFFFFRLGMGLEKVAGRFLCFIIVLASLAVTAFFVVGYIYLRKENFIGFFISSEGFNDISTGHRYGIVEWEDVVKIRIIDDLDHPGKKYISLKIKNPQEYIAREQIMHKRRSLELKLHYYGSPICFSNRGLDCSFEELEETIRLYYNNYLERKEERENRDSKIDC